MISETAYSSKTKLLGLSLLIGEHGIGYSNLAFAANKGQKRLIFSGDQDPMLKHIFDAHVTSSLEPS